MRSIFKLFLVLNMILVSISFTFASLTCCFDGSNFNVLSEGSCPSGELDFQGISQLGNNPCDFGIDRLSCKSIVDGDNYCNFLGNQIYEVPGYKNFIQTKTGLDIDNYCESVAYVNNCKQSDPPIATSSQTGTDDTGISGGGSVVGGGSEVVVVDDNELLEKQEEEARKTCSDLGGPFGFFINKDSCNNFVDSNNENSCLYNPYLGGLIGISSTSISSGLNNMEVSCIPKLSIKSCNDYKTEDNCNSNPIINTIYTTNDLAFANCVWVPTNDFLNSSEYFQVESGICISDSTYETKNYDLSFYSNRGNMLKNPSFEEDGSWSNLNRIENSVDAFNGFSYARIDSQNYISQIIEYVSERTAYETLFYIKTNRNFRQGDIVTIEISSLKLVNDVLIYDDSKSYDIDLSDFNQSDGIFKKHKIYENFVTDSEVIAIELNIFSNVLVDIDSVYFGVNDVKFQTGDNGIFKPLEIITSKASSCEICFDEKNLNFCTKEKSDLLGDCSYMVDSVSQEYKSILEDDYLGSAKKSEGGNPYLGNFSSQSLANSLVFCELYLTQDTCEDPNNFLNSVISFYHFESDSNLCKWNDEFGCFKDSDNSNGPDTINNGAVYVSTSQTGLTDKISSQFFTTHYNKTRTGNFPSDFELGCDVLPPEFYISFEAQYENLSKVYITEDFPNEVIGRVILDVESYDIDLESCSPFNIDKKIYIDYTVSNENGINRYYRTLLGNYFDERSLIQYFFTDNDGNTILEEGENSFRIFSMDQSGNVGKIRDFGFDVDLYGPIINILETPYSFNYYGMYGPNSILNFEISDTKSSVSSCNFTLEPEGEVDYTFYNSTGDFLDFTDSENYDDSNFEFRLPIYNTSVNGDLYTLKITCVDVFNQETSEEYTIGVDFDTSFILLSPQDLYGVNEPHKFEHGFINSKQDLFAVSEDTGIDGCRFDFSETDGDEEINIELVMDTFDQRGHNFEPYMNITGWFDFISDGIKEFSVICEDINGNEYTQNLKYYYDTSLPKLLDFNLIDTSINRNTVYYDGSNYYTRRIDKNSMTLSNRLNLSLDGTGSWISSKSESYNISLWDEFEGEYDLYDSASFYPKIRNNTFVGDLIIDNYVDLSKYNTNTSYENLYERRHRINFSDKAGNVDSSVVSYYFDNSNPRFVFAGDIFENGDLYTKEVNPEFLITFATPDYRTFECQIELEHENLLYRQNFDSSNSINFRISDIIGNSFEFKQNSNLDIKLDCIDVYGINLNKKYTVKYDNTPPILKSAHLEGGNNIYLANAGNNVVYKDIIDKIVFNFEDTYEDGYSCHYNFKEQDTYSTCLDEKQVSVFDANSNNLRYTTSSIDILYDLSSTSQSICYRDRNYLNPILENFRNTQKTLYSVIQVGVECFDLVNFSTGVYNFDVNINYVAGNKFVDFDVEYNLNSVKFVARSMTQFDSVLVSFDDVGEEVLTSLQYSGEKDGLFVYSSNYDISGIDEGFSPLRVFAIGFGSDGSLWDRISTNLIIDRIEPVIDLRFPDANSNGEVFFSDFQILFDVLDEGGSAIYDVEFYLGDDLLFSANNMSNFDERYLYEPDVTRNSYSIDRNNFYGSLIFLNGIIGEEYEFKVVARDGFGNTAIANRTIIVKDGIGIRLKDSNNAFVDFDRFSWITKVDAPIISFETSKPVVSCSIMPLRDNIWISLYSEDDRNKVMSLSGNIVDFSFDLSQFEVNFDLSQGQKKDYDMFIFCSNGSQIFNFTRTLSYINTLPDYVLSSSEGFLINNEPYQTNLDILSVGPYKHIKCSYSIDGSAFTQMGGARYSNRFVESIDFANFASGTYRVDLECEDKLGTKGPLKSYNFIVNQNLQTRIEDIKLTNGALEYDLIDNVFYVNSLDGFSLEFKANKNDLACSYNLVKYSGNPLSSLLSYLINLFVDNSKELESSSIPFVYKSTPSLSFNEGGANKLTIFCGQDNFDYDVHYIKESNFDFNLVKIN